MEMNEKIQNCKNNKSDKIDDLQICWSWTIVV